MERKFPHLFTEANDRDDFESDFLKVSVFYEDLNYQSIEEKPAYDVRIPE